MAFTCSLISTRYTPPGRGSSVACAPFQRTIFAGSVKNSKTVSGLASMCTSRSMTCSVWLGRRPLVEAEGRSRVLSVPASTLLPFLGFRLALELGEAERPEALQELLELPEAFRTGAVEAPRPLTPLAHETGLLEYAQVLRDRRSRDVETRRDLTSGQLTIADQLEDLPSPRLRERLDGRLHEPDL